eukprot:1083968_1
MISPISTNITNSPCKPSSIPMNTTEINPPNPQPSKKPTNNNANQPQKKPSAAAIDKKERKQLWQSLAKYCDSLIEEARSNGYVPTHRFVHPQPMIDNFTKLGLRPPSNLRGAERLYDCFISRSNYLKKTMQATPVEYTVTINSSSLPTYHPIIDHSVDAKLRENKIWVLSRTKEWRECCIIDSKQQIVYHPSCSTDIYGTHATTKHTEFIKVHWMHFDSKFDEWLPIDSERVSRHKPNKVTPHYIESNIVPTLGIKKRFQHAYGRFIITESNIFHDIIPGSQLIQINDQNITKSTSFVIDMMLENAVNAMKMDKPAELKLTFNMKDKSAFDVGLFFEIRAMLNTKKTSAFVSKFERAAVIDILNKQLCDQFEESKVEIFTMCRIKNGLKIVCFVNVDPVFIILNRWIKDLEMSDVIILDLQNIIKIYHSQMQTEKNLKTIFGQKTELNFKITFEIIKRLFYQKKEEISFDDVTVQCNECGFGMRNKYWSYTFDGDSVETENTTLGDLVHLVQWMDKGRSAWHYVLVDPDKLEGFQKLLNDDITHLEDYGVIMQSGYGKEPPKRVRERIEAQFLDLKLTK